MEAQVVGFIPQPTILPKDIENANDEAVMTWKQANYEAIRRYSGRILAVAEQYGKNDAQFTDQIYERLQKNALEILNSLTSLSPKLAQQGWVVPTISPQSVAPNSSSIERKAPVPTPTENADKQ